MALVHIPRDVSYCYSYYSIDHKIDKDHVYIGNVCLYAPWWEKDIYSYKVFYVFKDRLKVLSWEGII